MSPYYVSSTSRALYRVFIAPILPRASVHTCIIPSNVIKSRLQARPFSQTHLLLKQYKKDTRRHALSDHYIIDRAITAPRINFIDDKGRFFQDIALLDAQQTFNRTTHHLLQVSSGKPHLLSEDLDPFSEEYIQALPVCKAVPKMELRAQHEKKLDIERRQAKGLGTGPSPKNLELNWAIAGGDLKHRLEKLKGFLREGRKVEVLLGPKRKGRVATGEEARGVLKGLRDAVGEVKGATEVKGEGNVGAVMTLIFEGKKIEKEKAAVS